jgi:hypothetical protein
MTFAFAVRAMECALSPVQFSAEYPVVEKAGVFYCGYASALSRQAIEWERSRALESNRTLARGLDWC